MAREPSRNRFWACMALLTMLALLAPTHPAGAQPHTPATQAHTIRLKTRQFTPGPGLELAALQRAAGPDGRVHFLLQVEQLPTAEGRRQFAKQGVQLLSYVGGNTYIASAGTADLKNLQRMDGVRWAGPLEAGDKLSPDLLAGHIGQWARAEGGRAAFTIQVHPDVSIAEAEALVTRLGGTLVDSVPSIPSVTAIFPVGQARRIAREDAVQYVDAVGLPVGEMNDGAAVAAGVTPLAAAPYNLNGTGVTVLVYDSGLIDPAHTDFSGRILWSDPADNVRNHSTHVAGTVGGSGANSNGNDSAGNPNGGTAGQWAGMAPNVNFRTAGSSGSSDVLYDSAGDLNADFTTAITAGTDIATMSLGNNVVLNGFPCGQLGDYTNTAILIDNIVRGSINGQQLIFTEAAGNERQSGAPCGTYGSIASPSTAKNSISVGAINSNDNSMTGFSSWGPTDDGRLKPDIVAPGCQSTGDGGITSTGFDDTDGDGNLDAGETQNAYVVMCGTSMATPVTAGALALLVQQWQSTRGAGTRPLGHTAKAILIQTATDLGNAGPDYQNGHGALNAQAAVDLVRADDTADLIHVNQADQGDTVFYTFNSDGSADVQVTLVWSDPAATRLAATTLVNDLDLRLVAPDGTTYQPWVLNAGSPANAATTGNDAINPVEVVVGDAMAGTWEVRVSGTAVSMGPQQYTLITPADAAANNRRPSADVGGPYTTAEGTDMMLSAAGSTDPDGDVLTYAWDLDNDGAFDDATGVTATFSMVGQDGSFTVGVRATDPDGAFDTDQATVTVTNVAPAFTGLGSDAPQHENSPVTVSGSAADPGWLDGLTVTVNWNDGTPVQTLTGAAITAEENTRPDATVQFSASHTYGDNGPYTAQVCVADDDTQTCQNIALQVDNVVPTAVIDTSGATVINGAPTFMAHAGEPLTVSGDSQDPGSDDLTATWHWADGTPHTVTAYLANPPGMDPAMSPTIQPRSITDTQTHTFAGACFYEISFQVSDDDGGTSPADTASVVILGNADRARSAGYWSATYAGRGTREFSDATLGCYLAITRHMSLVFHEARALSTLQDARDVLRVNGNHGTMAELLDQQLLAAWLNFANGAVGYTELVDTDGDLIPDTPFHLALAAAEAVRLDPLATEAQLEVQKDMLERFNLMDEHN